MANIEYTEIQEIDTESLEFDTIQVGDVDGGDYFEVEEDGTIKCNGEAGCWRDELQSLISQQLNSPAGAVDYNYDEGTVDFANNSDMDDFVLMNVQINHDWNQTTPIEIHGHWFQNQSATPNMLIAYRWQTNGQPKVTDWTYTKYNESKFTYTSGTIMQITDFPEIAPPDPIGVSSIIQIKFMRDTGNDSELFTGEDAYTGTVSAINLDIHIKVDMLGSRTEYSK